MNLQKVQDRLNVFIDLNEKDLFTSKEYLTYIANLLFGIAIPLLTLDENMSNLDHKDYYNVEAFLVKYPDNPYLQLLLMAHQILLIIQENFE